MIFKRLRDITVATIHEGLDGLENPVVMLNQYLRDMEEEIKRAEKAISKQMLLQSSFTKDLEQAKGMVQKRMEQAEFAVKAGEEELARKALLSKVEFEEKVQYYTELVNNNEKSISDLKAQLTKILEKYQQLRDKKHALIARANAAKTKEGMQKTLSTFQNEKAAEGFRRMEERILDIETRSKLTESSVDALYQDKFSNLKHKELIDQELSSLKDKLTQNA